MAHGSMFHVTMRLMCVQLQKCTVPAPREKFPHTMRLMRGSKSALSPAASDMREVLLEAMFCADLCRAAAVPLSNATRLQ